MALPLMPGSGKLNFRPTAANNFGVTQGRTSINQPQGGTVSAAQLGRKNAVTSASQLQGTAHVYSSGDRTGMYSPGEEYGSRSSVSISQVINKKHPPRVSAANLPQKPPSAPIFPPL